MTQFKEGHGRCDTLKISVLRLAMILRKCLQTSAHRMMCREILAGRNYTIKYIMTY